MVADRGSQGFGHGDEDEDHRFSVKSVGWSRETSPLPTAPAQTFLVQDFNPGQRICIDKDDETLVVVLRGSTEKREKQDTETAHSSLAGRQAAQATGGLRTMSLSRDFKETIQARVQRAPAFGEELAGRRVPAVGRRGHRQGGPAWLHQRDHRVPGIGRSNREIAQESDAHVRPQRRPASPEPVPGHRRSSGTRGDSPQSLRGSPRGTTRTERIAQGWS